MKINKELLKGSGEIAILTVLKSDPLYGYEIAKKIRSQSKDLFAMGEGTLYPILHKLEQQKLLRSYWQEFGGRRRKYYALTKQGQKVLESKIAEWQAFAAGMQSLTR